MDDLVKRLRDCEFMGMPDARLDYSTAHEAADRIEALEQDLKAVLRREEDANRAAMKHLRALEQERIKSKNYADFSHEWRRRCEALERQVKAADEMAAMARKVCAGAVNPRTGGRTILERDVVALHGAEGDYTAAKGGGA